MKVKVLMPLLFLVTVSFSQNSTRRLDSLSTALFAHGQLNGNILVAENGVPVYHKSFGYADVRSRTLNQEDAGFSLASVAKVLTATAILQLKEQWSVQLDDRVVKYIPDFPYAAITIRHLLTHTSGLPEIDILRKQVQENRQKVFTNQDFLPALIKQNLPLDFQPNDNYQYTNSNYIVLALLVEKITNQPFQEYLQKNIFTPAAMGHTYFQKNTAHPANKQRVIDHDYPFLFSTELSNVDSLPKFRIRLFNLSGFVGNGNIITTTGDMLNFDRALYAGKLINQSSLKEAFTPNRLNNGQYTHTTLGGENASYGLGWFILSDSSKGKIVGHTGGVPGALSIFLRNMDKKQTVILFDNAFNRSLYKSGLNAMSILNNKPVTIARQSLVKEYGSMLVNTDIDIAFTRFQELRNDTAHYFVSEEEMNDLGLQLLYEPHFTGHNELALEVLKLNTLLFPKSFNTYDSYGEALAKLGKKKQAIFMYRKSIELNPDNQSGKKILEGLLGK